MGTDSQASSIKPRSAYIDLVKGWLIFLVVWGHAIQFTGYSPTDDWLSAPFWSDPVFKLFYLFHMPLFMGISGYLCFSSIQKHALTTTAGRRFRQLIIPVIAWGVIWPICMVALAWARGRASVEPLPLLGLIGTEISTRFWFLWAVFAGTCLAAAAWRWKQDRPLGFVLITIGLLLFPDVGIVPMVKYTVPFFFVGYLLRQRNVNLLAAGTWPRLAVIGLIGIACYALWSPATYVYTSGLRLTVDQIPRISFVFLAGGTGSVLFLYLTFRLFRHWQPSWILCFGRRSLEIYIFQTFVFLLLHGRTHPMQDTLYFSVFIAPVVALAVCFGCVAAGVVLERIPLVSDVFLGRPAQPFARRSAGNTSGSRSDITCSGSPIVAAEGKTRRPAKT